MVLFCIVYMKTLKLKHVTNSCLEKCKKNVTDVRKAKIKERRFPS